MKTLAYENETRIFTKYSSTNTLRDKVDFYAKNMLVPYIPFCFPKSTIKEIIIGPMANQDLTENSLQLLKLKYQYNFDIIKSKIPYRVF